MSMRMIIIVKMSQFQYNLYVIIDLNFIVVSINND